MITQIVFANLLPSILEMCVSLERTAAMYRLVEAWQETKNHAGGRSTNDWDSVNELANLIPRNGGWSQ